MFFCSYTFIILTVWLLERDNQLCEKDDFIYVCASFNMYVISFWRTILLSSTHLSIYQYVQQTFRRKFRSFFKPSKNKVQLKLTIVTTSTFSSQFRDILPEQVCKIFYMKSTLGILTFRCQKIHFFIQFKVFPGLLHVKNERVGVLVKFDSFHVFIFKLSALASQSLQQLNVIILIVEITSNQSNLTASSLY